MLYECLNVICVYVSCLVDIILREKKNKMVSFGMYIKSMLAHETYFQWLYGSCLVDIILRKKKKKTMVSFGMHIKSMLGHET